MLASRWVRFKRSGWRLACAFLGTVMSAGLGTSLLAGTDIDDDAGRVLAAVPISLLLWVWGAFLSPAIYRSDDEILFALTPLTPRRFFARNLRNFFSVHVYLFVAVPWLLWWLVSHDSGDTIDPLIPVSGFLTYYVLLLGPASEYLGGQWSPSRILFVPRHILRFGVVPVLLVAAAGAMSLFLAMRSSLDVLRSIVDSLLQAGALGLATITVVSPASGVAALAERDANHELLLAFCVSFALILAWQLIDIARAVRSSVTQSENRQLEAWLDHRTELIEQADEFSEMEEGALQAWSAERAKLEISAQPNDAAYHTDPPPVLNDSGPLEYDTSYSPENQMLRHAKYAQSAAGVSGVLPFLRRNSIRIAWFTLVLVLIGLGDRSSRGDGKATMNIAAFVVFGRGMLILARSAAWEPITRMCLAVPVRVPRLAAFAWRAQFGFDFVWDLVFAAAFVFLSGAPIWSMAALLIGFQFVRLSGHLSTFVRLTRRKGALQDLSLHQCLELFVGTGTVVWFAVVSTSDDLRPALSDPTLYVILLLAWILPVAYGSLTILWRHRRADMSLMRNRLAQWGV